MMNNKNTGLIKRWAYFLLLATTFYPAALWNASCNDKSDYEECEDEKSCEDDGAAEDVGIDAPTAYCVGSPDAACLGETVCSSTSYSTITSALAARASDTSSEATIIFTGDYSEQILLTDSALSGTNIIGCSTDDTISYPGTPADVSEPTVQISSAVSDIGLYTMTVEGIKDLTAGSSDDTLNSMAATIRIDDTKNVEINGVLFTKNYVNAMRVDNAATVTLSNTTYTDFSPGAGGAYTSTVAIYNAGGATITMNGNSDETALIEDSTLDVLVVSEVDTNVLSMTDTWVAGVNLAAAVLFDSNSVTMDNVSLENDSIGVYAQNPAELTMNSSYVGGAVGVVGCQTGTGSPGNYNLTFNRMDGLYNSYFGEVTLGGNENYTDSSGDGYISSSEYHIYGTYISGSIELVSGSDFETIFDNATLVSETAMDTNAVIACDLGSYATAVGY